MSTILASAAVAPPATAPAGDGWRRRACRLVAWALCVGGIVAAGTAGFAVVERHARDAFRARFGRPGVPMVDVRDVTGAVRLAAGATVEQPFRTDRDDLDGLQVRTVNWRTTPAPSACRWRLEAETPDGTGRRVLREGTIDPRQAGDWSFLEIGFEPVADSGRLGLVFVVCAPPDDPGAVMGVPLFVPATAHPPAVVRAAEVPATGCLHLMLLHPGDEP